jgi:hypothetical protein
MKAIENHNRTDNRAAPGGGNCVLSKRDCRLVSFSAANEKVVVKKHTNLKLEGVNRELARKPHAAFGRTSSFHAAFFLFAPVVPEGAIDGSGDVYKQKTIPLHLCTRLCVAACRFVQAL